MGKKKRGHPDVEEVLSRPWCYYCERDFEDLKLLISHQKAKHFKCDRCGRRLNTAGGLSVHMNQVHKESLDQVENALPNRQGLEVEIFGMEGIPQEVLENHRNRLVQNFYQAQEDRRMATGNPLPGQAKNQRKKIKIETAEELKRRLAEWRAKRKAAAAAGVPFDGVPSVEPARVPQQSPAQAGYGYAPESVPGRPPSHQSGQTGLPQRPGDGGGYYNAEHAPPAGAPVGAHASEAGAKTAKKDKDKKGRMFYDDADTSPEERMAALPRYAVLPAA